jgi:hypothetical protein
LKTHNAECQPLEQVHVLLVLQERAAQRRDQRGSRSLSISGDMSSLSSYVDKVLKSAKPADLPVEEPSKIELVVSLKTAKALALVMPESFLVRVDEVIEE